jgi:hypothetical protein
MHQPITPKNLIWYERVNKSLIHQYLGLTLEPLAKIIIIPHRSPWPATLCTSVPTLRWVMLLPRTWTMWHHSRRATRSPLPLWMGTALEAGEPLLRHRQWLDSLGDGALQRRPRVPKFWITDEWIPHARIKIEALFLVVYIAGVQNKIWV